MSFYQLQSLVVPGILIAVAGIGLILLRSELRNPGKSLFPRKKKGRLLKFVSGQKRYRKAG